MTDSDEATLYKAVDGVATITLNRPENKNALSVEMVNSLGDNLEAAQSDPKVRVILFTNNGNTFCAGADLKANQPGVTQPAARHSFVQILDDIIESPKPVLGRIAGHCTGGGVGLAASRYFNRRRRHHYRLHRGSNRGSSCSYLCGLSP